MELIIFCVVLLILIALVIDIPKSKKNKKNVNVSHIEWNPKGNPVLVKRLPAGVEIRPSGTQKGYYSFMGMSKIRVKGSSNACIS